MSHEHLGERARLAWAAIDHAPDAGIPTWLINPMEWCMIDRLAGAPEDSYARDPVTTYRRMFEEVGVCLVDQWIPENPLSMGHQGYEGAVPGTTTGAREIVCDGMVIDSPEAVVAHLERVEFPRLQAAACSFDEDARAGEILTEEVKIQRLLGPNMLKTGYGYLWFPTLAYGTYGYESYFMAFALYPEVIERHFALQADLALRNNRAAARAVRTGALPPLFRLDHDMADSRGTLVRIEALDRLWFPHFARSLAPVLNDEMTLIWHCDGNLSQLAPRLLEVGISGFQGFQYEDGMDYPAICRLKTRNGAAPFIIAGVSVTRTLPYGTPADVKQELRWLVEHGPRTGLVLGASSSITPEAPWENLQMLVEGLAYYRARGRS